MSKLNATDLYVIASTLGHSLNVSGYFPTSKEARDIVLDKIFGIMSEMHIDIVQGKVDPITITGDIGG
jgi:hypothetical protein